MNYFIPGGAALYFKNVNHQADEEQDADCTVLVVSLNTTMEKSGTMCEMLQMGAHTLCWYGGRVYLLALSGMNTVLFLVCILRICNFFKFCDYSLCFLGK